MLIDQLPEITTANDADELPIEQGTTTRKIKFLNLLKGVLKLIGGTLTGDLQIKSSNIEINEASDAWGNASVYLNDKNNARMAIVRAFHFTNGMGGIQLGGHNGSTENVLRLMVNSSGERNVSVSDSAAWRNALGLGAITSTTTANNIITAASGITIVAAAYSQWGKVANLYLRWKSSSAVSVGVDGNATNVTVGTLLSGKRPAITSAGFSMGDAAGPAFYQVAAGGSVVLCACGGTGASRTIAAGTEFYLNSTYILA